MALVIEDGTNVAGANSYATVAEILAYALARGATIEAPAAEILAIKAMDYLAAQEARYKGERTYADQTLSWPRSSVCIYNRAFPKNQIPAQLKQGQCALAMAAVTVDLLPTIDPAMSGIKVDKTGPLTTEFFGPRDGAFNQPVITTADAAMSELYKTNRFSLKVDRA